MANESPVEGRCNAETADGGHCANYPYHGAEDGKCVQHTDENAESDESGSNKKQTPAKKDKETDKKGSKKNSGQGGPIGNQHAKGNKGGKGAPKGNVRALKHGATADPGHLLAHLDDDARAFVDEIYSGYMSIAPFDASDTRSERVRVLAVMCYQEWQARGQVQKDTNGSLTVSNPIGTDASGNAITKREAHYLLSEASRLNRDIRSLMKTLSVEPDTPDDDGIGGVGGKAGDLEIVIPAKNVKNVE